MLLELKSLQSLIDAFPVLSRLAFDLLWFVLGSSLLGLNTMG